MQSLYINLYFYFFGSAIISSEDTSSAMKPLVSGDGLILHGLRNGSQHPMSYQVRLILVDLVGLVGEKEKENDLLLLGRLALRLALMLMLRLALQRLELR